ncbi:MAG TPA: cytochrome c [Pyrinomonadaceae bacterium]|nr:cytochrome c [Pyrinomonadaceae bacterium]
MPQILLIPEWWRKNDTRTATLISVVTRGKAGMPAFGKKLKKGEISLLVARVRRFRK